MGEAEQKVGGVVLLVLRSVVLMREMMVHVAPWEVEGGLKQEKEKKTVALHKAFHVSEEALGEEEHNSSSLLEVEAGQQLWAGIQNLCQAYTFCETRPKIGIPTSMPIPLSTERQGVWRSKHSITGQ